VPITSPFDLYTEAYDAWFDACPWAFLSEVEALRHFMPPKGEFLEVGVGTGRFAQALGIQRGVDPSPSMRAWSQRRGIEAVEGVAEALPFEDGRFDAVVMVTTLCFLDDAEVALAESKRVLKPGGRFIAGFVDARSDLGRSYQERRGESRFCGGARFWNVPDFTGAILRAGFVAPLIAQTLFRPMDSMRDIEPARPGYGEGSFVVVATAKEREMGVMPAGILAKGEPQQHWTLPARKF
jgi:SAM-dependent methyltransferase